MNTKDKPKKLNNNITECINSVLSQTDAVVIGAGAGLSASAGLNYNDPTFFAQHYAPFLHKGYRTIAEGIGQNWELNANNAANYWAFWATHIYTIYYKHAQLETYKLLYDKIKNKEYFIITTNGDGQFFKGGFDENKIFAMQGNYGKLQCQQRCHEVVYNNEQIIQSMLQGINYETLTIKEDAVPRCPKCGELLCPNLRIDSSFVEGPNMLHKDDYIEFINEHADHRIVFLELGVGYNTPVIIRFPFQEMTEQLDNSFLIRVNQFYPEIPEKIIGRAIGIQSDVHEVIQAIN